MNISKEIVPVAEDSALSKETKAFLAALNAPGGPGLETLSPEDARQVLISAQQSVEVDYSGIKETEKTITAYGYTVKLNIVKPEGATNTLPVFIFIHGGGWVLGDYPTHKRMVRDLVVLSGVMKFMLLRDGWPKAVRTLAWMESGWLSLATALAAICLPLAQLRRKRRVVRRLNCKF